MKEVRDKSQQQTNKKYAPYILLIATGCTVIGLLIVIGII